MAGGWEGIGIVADFDPASLYAGYAEIVEISHQQIGSVAHVVCGVEANEEARISHVGLRKWDMLGKKKKYCHEVEENDILMLMSWM